MRSLRLRMHLIYWGGNVPNDLLSFFFLLSKGGRDGVFGCPLWDPRGNLQETFRIVRDLEGGGVILER